MLADERGWLQAIFQSTGDGKGQTIFGYLSSISQSIGPGDGSVPGTIQAELLALKKQIAALGTGGANIQPALDAVANLSTKLSGLTLKVAP